MKRRLTGIMVATVLLFSLVLSSGAVYADDESLPSPGITPDSPLYFLDKFNKNLNMFFTFGTEAKAKKALKYAEERLAEAREMASENKTAELERAIADYEKFIEWLRQRTEEIRSNDIREKVALATAKHVDVLEKVREKVPEKARLAVAHAANVSINGQVKALRALSKEKLDRTIDICDNVTARQMEKVRNRFSDNTTSDNRTAAISAAALDYAERIADLEDEIVAAAAAKGIDVSALLERLAHSTANRLDTLSGVYDKVPEQAKPVIANAIENSVKKYEKALDKISGNVTAVSANATFKIPEQLRERLQISTSNRLQINSAATDNGTIKVKINPAKPKEPGKPENNTGVKP